jgi:hypothetical protein
LSAAKSDTFVDDKKTQEQMEEELGVGVEKLPQLPKKPKLTKVNLSLTQANDVKDFMEQIADLPDPKSATDSVNKYDEYERAARRMWVIKQSEKPSFDVQMRILLEKKKVGDYDLHIWERQDGKLKTETKRFYYSGATIQEKDLIFNLIAQRESSSYDLNRFGDKLKEIAKIDDDKLTEEQRSMLDKKEWLRLAQVFNLANQTYYITKFKIYYGATDDEIDRIEFSDIVNGVEIGEYIEGVKSPQSDEP